MAWLHDKPPIGTLAFCAIAIAVSNADQWLNPLRPGPVALAGRWIGVACLLVVCALLARAMVRRRRP